MSSIIRNERSELLDIPSTQETNQKPSLEKKATRIIENNAHMASQLEQVKESQRAIDRAIDDLLAKPDRPDPNLSKISMIGLVTAVSDLNPSKISMIGLASAVLFGFALYQCGAKNIIYSAFFKDH